MAEFQVSVTLEAPDLLAAVLKVTYPEGKPLEGITHIEGKPR